MTAGCIELRQIPRCVFFELRASPIDLPACKIAIAVVHGFELGAIDGDAGFRQQPDLAALLHKLRADLLDG